MIRLGLGLRQRGAGAWALVEAGLVRLKPEPSIPERIARRAPAGRWFVSREEGRAIASAWPADPVVRDATRCLAHEFDLLGTQVRAGRDGLPWHEDVRSRRIWPRIYHKRLRLQLTGVGGSDVKLPWELSRCQHFVVLAQAYFRSGEPAYAQRAAADISDWLVKNPFRQGVNWTSAMEVGIRACNWLWAWWAFAEDPAWPEELRGRVVRSLWQHAWYIEHNLEDHEGVRTNHYLSNVVGLLFVSVMLPSLPRAASRRSFALRELARCMEEMVYPDGVSFENSLSYHRFVVELFTWSGVLCRLNGLELPHPFWERLERMFEVLHECTRPDARLPMIGDADDGRLFAVEGYDAQDRWDCRDLLSAGAVLFRRLDFQVAAGRRYPTLDWLLGAEGIASWNAL